MNANAQDIATLADDAQYAACLERLVEMKREVVRRIALAVGVPDPFLGDAGRVQQVKVASAVPDRCGPEIIPAPARGPMIAFAPIAVQPKGASDWEVQHVGHWGRDAARAADAFDLMEAQARRRQGEAYLPLFSKAEVEAGRLYSALTERHNASGVRGISIETLMAGRSGGGQGSFMDAVLHEGRQIDAMHAAIGDALVFGEQADARGQVVRPALSVRTLVDQVCCGGMTVSQVIKRAGRHADGERCSKVRSSLRAALRRMFDAHGT